MYFFIFSYLVEEQTELISIIIIENTYETEVSLLILQILCFECFHSLQSLAKWGQMDMVNYIDFYIAHSGRTLNKDCSKDSKILPFSA